jgi:uncharacterized protein (DUF4415 family)
MKKANDESDPLAAPRALTGKAIVRRGAAGKVASREAVEPRNIKVQISIKLDADVLEHFKARANQPGATPYQTQINQVLRDAMERDRDSFPGEALIRDERFVDALAKKVQQRLKLKPSA